MKQAINKTGILHRIEKKHYIIGFLVAIALWFISGLLTPSNNKNMENQISPLFKVRVYKSNAQLTAPTLRLFGQTKAINDVVLQSNTTNRVQIILKKQGDYVKKGELIVGHNVDAFKARLAQAKAAVEQATIDYNSAKKLAKSNFQTKNNVYKFMAMLQASKAQLSQAQQDLDNNIIMAPISGIINDLNVSIGDQLKKGQIIGSIVDGAALKAVFHVPELDVNDLDKNHSCKITRKKDSWDGKITHIAQKATLPTRTFEVEATLDNNSKKLKPGFTVAIEVNKNKVLAHELPISTIVLSKAGKPMVKYIDDDKQVRNCNVTVLAQKGPLLTVAGLPQVVTIIVSGQNFVQAGDIVTTQVLSNVQYKNEYSA